MKKLILLFMLASVFFNANAQSKMIKEVFRLLPANEVYDLTLATRDSMLGEKTYYPVENDSDHIMAYNHGMSTIVKDYMFVSVSFESKQTASGFVEIRSFKKTNGDNLIVVSKTSGELASIDKQLALSTFIYSKNKKLVRYQKTILPAADEIIFMKAGIPDSIKKFILDNATIAFDLHYEKLMLSLNSDLIVTNKAVRKWLKGDRIYFDWIKDRFVAGKMEFKYPD